MKDAIRRWILTGLSCPAAACVLRRLLRDGVFCVMLHRIGEKDPTRLPPNEDMKVSPAFLERFIIDARHKGFTFLSVSQLHAALTGEGPWPSRRQPRDRFRNSRSATSGPAVRFDRSH